MIFRVPHVGFQRDQSHIEQPPSVPFVGYVFHGLAHQDTVSRDIARDVFLVLLRPKILIAVDGRDLDGQRMGTRRRRARADQRLQFVHPGGRRIFRQQRAGDAPAMCFQPRQVSGLYERIDRGPVPGVLIDKTPFAVFRKSPGEPFDEFLPERSLGVPQRHDIRQERADMVARKDRGQAIAGQDVSGQRGFRQPPEFDAATPRRLIFERRRPVHRGAPLRRQELLQYLVLAQRGRDVAKRRNARVAFVECRECRLVRQVRNRGHGKLLPLGVAQLAVPFDDHRGKGLGIFEVHPERPRRLQRKTQHQHVVDIVPCAKGLTAGAGQFARHREDRPSNAIPCLSQCLSQCLLVGGIGIWRVRNDALLDERNEGQGIADQEIGQLEALRHTEFQIR